MVPYIALLRGINVGGRNKIAMPELRSLCAELGWSDVQTYIQSGNLVFKAFAKPAELEAELEGAIEDRLGLTIPAIVRPANAWDTYVESNPFPEASRSEPNLVMLLLSKKPPQPGVVEGLRERATKGERIVKAGDALWIHYAGGSGRSKLTTPLLDRLVGSIVTTRNWRTVLKIEDLVHS